MSSSMLAASHPGTQTHHLPQRQRQPQQRQQLYREISGGEQDEQLIYRPEERPEIVGAVACKGRAVLPITRHVAPVETLAAEHQERKHRVQNQVEHQQEADAGNLRRGGHHVTEDLLHIAKVCHQHDWPQNSLKPRHIRVDESDQCVHQGEHDVAQLGHWPPSIPEDWPRKVPGTWFTLSTTQPHTQPPITTTHSHHARTRCALPRRCQI